MALLERPCELLAFCPECARREFAPDASAGGLKCRLFSVARSVAQMADSALSLLFAHRGSRQSSGLGQRLPRDDYVPPSLGESVRKRLW
jgi:hypothetical protein